MRGQREGGREGKEKEGEVRGNNNAKKPIQAAVHIATVYSVPIVLELSLPTPTPIRLYIISIYICSRQIPAEPLQPSYCSFEWPGS